MADQSPPIQFEDVPLDEARRISRGPRMETLLYAMLRAAAAGCKILRHHRHIPCLNTPLAHGRRRVRLSSPGYRAPPSGGCPA
jgi:hypothetical protein